MSTIVNRIATVFTASGGNVRAVMGQVAGGMTNVENAAMRTNRQTSLLSNQMRALGTTIRYAIAGTAVFGATGLVRGLSQMQTQLALISTLAQDTNDAGLRVQFTGQRLRAMFDELQVGSMQALTPVNELGDSTINLLSSVQGVATDHISRIVTDLSQAAQLAQTPVEDLTKGVTGMIQAFGKAPTERNFSAMARGFLTLTRRAPGGIAAGPQIVQQLGPAALAARIARISPQQLFGMITTVLRAGGSPATGMRGLNFLLQSIATPNKAEAKVLAQVGITPESVQREGGLRSIMRLVAAMRAQGVRGNTRRNAPFFMASDEQLEGIEGAGMQGLQGLGVSGQGLLLAQRAVGRIHGVRALVALVQQLQTGNLQRDIEASDRSFREIGKEGKSLADQFKRFRDQQPLRAAAIGLQNLAIEAPRALERLLNPVARQVNRVGAFAVGHPHGTRQVMAGAAGLMAALGVAGFVVPGARRLFRGISGGLGQAFVRERAVEAALDPRHAGTLGGSPQNPLYVTVVGQLFGGGAQDRLPVDAPGGERWLKRVLGTAGLARFLPRIAAAAGVGYVLQRELREGPHGHTAGELVPHFLKGHPGGHRRTMDEFQQAEMFVRTHPQARFDPRSLLVHQQHLGRITERQAAIQLRSGIVQADRLERLNRILAPFHRRDPLYGVTAIYSQRRERIHGKAQVVLDVNLSTAKGIVRKRIEIPMDLYSGGRNPSSRGQAGKTKAKVP